MAIGQKSGIAGQVYEIASKMLALSRDDSGRVSVCSRSKFVNHLLIQQRQKS
jgi:hypothetical protein